MPNVVQRRVALLSDDGKFADSMTPQAVLDAVEHVDQAAESIDGALAEMLAKSANLADVPSPAAARANLGAAAVDHTHTPEQVIGLPAALDAKADLVGGVIPTSQIPREAMGDLEVQNATYGLVLRSPDGSRWRQTINNQGVTAWTKLISLPAGFADVPFTLMEHPDGSITHDFDFAPYREGTEIWVNQSTGSFAGPGTKAAPYRPMSQAMAAALATEGDVVIRVQGTITRSFAAFASAPTIPAGRRISIIGGGPEPAAILAANEAMAWSDLGGGVWAAARTGVGGVLSTGRDENGMFVPLGMVTSTDAVAATLNSWHTDGATVWVNTGGAAPTVATHHITLNVIISRFVLEPGATLYVENIDFLTSSIDVQGVGGRLILNDVRVTGAGPKIIADNAVTVVGLSQALLFNVTAAHGTRDGFNYHYGTVPEADRRACLAVEHGCLSYSHGTYDTNNNNNATSAHEGISVLRVGTVGRDTTGPSLADVGGCLSVNHDCEMTNGTWSYVFNGGEAWLYDCRSTAPRTGHINGTATIHGELITA